MVAPADSPAQRRSPSTGGFRTVWPGLGLVLLVAAVAYVAVPSARHQLDLSLSRQDTPFVELSAAPLEDGVHVGTTCAAGSAPGTTAVTFTVRSHLPEQETLRYQVIVSRVPDRESEAVVFGDRLFGRLGLEAGAERTVRHEVPVPGKGAFDVRVVLPASEQYLLLHCDPAAAADPVSDASGAPS